MSALDDELMKLSKQDIAVVRQLYNQSAQSLPGNELRHHGQIRRNNNNSSSAYHSTCNDGNSAMSSTPCSVSCGNVECCLAKNEADDSNCGPCLLDIDPSGVLCRADRPNYFQLEPDMEQGFQRQVSVNIYHFRSIIAKVK